ncbi:MAG TPA: hypothetical protein VJS89_04340 [Gammaproteobacteria bacterium]|nr:hypothetical protein [Gammaproteobacteria bacterium]
MLIRDTRAQRLLLTIAVLAMLAAVALAYAPGLSGGFMFDDITNIVMNPFLALDHLGVNEMLRAAFSVRSGPLYRPISMLSLALNLYFFGPHPFSFKLVNVAIHLVNALLLLWLTRRLLINCRRRYGFEWSSGTLNWASVIIAAAWALHPLNLPAVLYIVQRMTSLAALCTLAAMLAYMYGRERTLAGKRGWPLLWVLTPLFGAIGLFCKEDAALLPLYLLVIEWLVFGFRNQSGRTSRNVLAFYAVGLVLPGLLGSAFLVHQRFWEGFAGRNFTLTERVLTEFRVVLLYVKWTFFPDIRELALYHDDIRVSTGLLHPLTTLWSLLALLAMLAVAFWQRRRRPLICLGILFFFAGQMMESTLLPLELAFEHRNYLPDYGLIMAFFSLLLLPVRTGRRYLRVSLSWTLAAVILPVLFAALWLRAWEWKDPLSFSYYETLHHPQSKRAQYRLGQVYANLALDGALKNPEIAMQTLAKSARLSNDIMPDVAMMIVAAKLNLPVNPDWENHAQWFLQNLPFSPQDANSLDSLVNCLPTSCQTLVPQATALFQSVLKPGSRAQGALSNPDFWVIYGNYLTFTGHPLNEVVATLEKAATLAPTVPIYRINLAKGYIVTEDWPKAEQQIQALKRLNFLGHLDTDIQQLNKSLTTARDHADDKPSEATGTPGAGTLR